MAQRDVARLLVKIAGLLIVVYSMHVLPYQALTALVSLQQGSRSSSGIDSHLYVGMTITPAVISIGLGLALFWSSGSIVNRLLSPTPEGAAPGLDWRGIETVAIAVLGAYLFADALAELPAWLDAIVRQIQEARSPQLGLATRTWSWVVWSTAIAIAGVCMQLGIGVALMIWSKPLVSLRLRLAEMATARRTHVEP
jgi:hypothetical protein